MVIKCSYFFIPSLSPDWLLIPRGLSINHSLPPTPAPYLPPRPQHTHHEGVLGGLEAFQAVYGEGIANVGIWAVDKLVGGSPGTPSCLGDPFCLPHKGVHRLRKLGSSVDNFLPCHDAASETAPLVTFSFAGPGTRPSGVMDSPLTQQSGAAIPSERWPAIGRLDFTIKVENLQGLLFFRGLVTSHPCLR